MDITDAEGYELYVSRESTNFPESTDLNDLMADYFNLMHIMRNYRKQFSRLDPKNT
jgi:hypothetical protein